MGGHHAHGQDKGLAIASMVLGIVTFVVGCFGPLGMAGLITAPLAVILGAIHNGRVNRNPQQYGGKGMAIAGIVLGIVALAFIVLALFVFAAFFATLGAW